MQHLGRQRVGPLRYSGPPRPVPLPERPPQGKLRTDSTLTGGKLGSRSNCNAFVADIANFMGLKAPSSSWIYPRVFVNGLRKINTGHPEAANQLISDNVK